MNINVDQQNAGGGQNQGGGVVSPPNQGGGGQNVGPNVAAQNVTPNVAAPVNGSVTANGLVWAGGSRDSVVRAMINQSPICCCSDAINHWISGLAVKKALTTCGK